MVMRNQYYFRCECLFSCSIIYDHFDFRSFAVLKIVGIQTDGQLKDLRNLRGKSADSKTHANDVEWNPLYNSEILATANTNGTVGIWDLNVKGMKGGIYV